MRGKPSLTNLSAVWLYVLFEKGSGRKMYTQVTGVYEAPASLSQAVPVQRGIRAATSCKLLVVAQKRAAIPYPLGSS